MDYVRVDWDNGDYSYFENDTFSWLKNEYRSKLLISNSFYYKRIKRLKELPIGKCCAHYKRHNKQKEDWEIIED